MDENKKKEVPQGVEVEQAAPADELQQVKGLLSTYGRETVITVLLAVVVAGAVVLYRGRTDARRAQASVMLSAARTIPDLEAVVTGYASTPSGPFALIRLAKAYYDAGNYDAAISRYVDFKARFPQHELAPAAELGRVHGVEAKGQLADALAGFAAFVKEYPDHIQTSQAVFGQGRCLETLGRLDEARTVYEDFVAAHPKSLWVSRAEEQLSSVRKKLETKPSPAQPAAGTKPEAAAKEPAADTAGAGR